MGTQVNIQLGSRQYVVVLDGNGAEVNGQSVRIDKVLLDGRGGFVIRTNGRVLRGTITADGENGLLTLDGHEIDFAYETERHRLLKRFASAGHATHGHAEIKASMPGMVVRIAAEKGTAVTKGQPVLILEAMKMENEIRAPMSGTVEEVRVAQGQAVEKGDLLMVLNS